MHVRSDVINALLPNVSCFVDSRFSALQRTTPHATICNNALMTSERTRIDNMYESWDTLWDQPQKTGNASRPGNEPSIVTNSSRMARCQESMAGGVTFPNQAFQGTFSPLSQYGIERCIVEE